MFWVESLCSHIVIVLVSWTYNNSNIIFTRDTCHWLCRSVGTRFTNIYLFKKNVLTRFVQIDIEVGFCTQFSIQNQSI